MRKKRCLRYMWRATRRMLEGGRVFLHPVLLGRKKKNAVRKHLCPLGFLRTAPFVPQRCVVLNLKRRPDRLALAEAQLTKWHPDWPDPQITEAVDGWGNPAACRKYRNRMKGPGAAR